MNLPFGKKKSEEPEYVDSPLNTPMLNYKVYVMSKPEAVLVRLALFLIGGCVGLLFYMNLFCVDGYPTQATYISNTVFFVLLGVVAVKVFVPVYRQSRLGKRDVKIATQFRDLLEALASSVSAGSNVNNAFAAALDDLRRQYDADDYIVRETEEIVGATRQGVGIDVMLRSFAARSGNEDIESFADVFEVCYRKGGDMASVIHRTRSVIGEKMVVSEEIKTTLTSNKMQHNVMSVMPIAIVAALRFSNDSFAENFATPTGVAVNTVAIVIFIAAYLYGNKIVEVRV